MYINLYQRGNWIYGSAGMLLILAAFFFTPYSTQASASGQMPDPVAAPSQWLNSPPLGSDVLRGKVVLVEFWTYSCINCLRVLPHVKKWADKYRSQGLVVIGVHTPEFSYEKDKGNVERAVKDLGITYPVVMDNQYEIWNAYGNRYWPALYLKDQQGKVQYKHFGEGAYQETEEMIQALLAELPQNSSASKR